MERHEPDPPEPREAGEKALRRLEQRLDRASEAAERLLSEAARSAAEARPVAGEPAASPADGADTPPPPPSGWQTPESVDAAGTSADFEALMQVVRSMRDLIPPDIQRRLLEALREVLLAVRALVDWYLERLERQRKEPVEIQDIPIL
jgi:hypothetical protein